MAGLMKRAGFLRSVLVRFVAPKYECDPLSPPLGPLGGEGIRGEVCVRSEFVFSEGVKFW